MADGQPAQRVARFRRDLHAGKIDAVFVGVGALHRGQQGDVSGLADHPPKPVRACDIGERDVRRRIAGRRIDDPRQHGAADLQHGDQRWRGAHRTGAPEAGLGDQSHPATCNSSIALMRCR
ncbi:hypothetical protein BN971_02248 [Mycobacterium bohemicum DSM 44277]|uniref:Uncharacterized protein n=1 Tax=Mycobacterium bohemicum DSM 44277 TaxID=1236609 RepID=A0A0U0W7R0_MYCBE|nr:hypothetical protein BN971_02248 [Mycobacterium bohemicum DSM 44277]